MAAKSSVPFEVTIDDPASAALATRECSNKPIRLPGHFSAGVMTEHLSALQYELLYVVAGNHDSVSGMRKFLLGGTIESPRLVDIGFWRIILLNSKFVGEPYGYLEESELNFLTEALGEDARRPTVICLHHSPTKPCSTSGCHLTNEEVFLKSLNGHPNARLVLAGHSHLELERKIAHNAPDHACIQLSVSARTGRRSGRSRRLLGIAQIRSSYAWI